MPNSRTTHAALAPISPLPDILEFLLTLFMARSGEFKRDDVREAARKAYIALSSYLKEQADQHQPSFVDLPHTNGGNHDKTDDIDLAPAPPRHTQSRTISRTVREHFSPRQRHLVS